MKPRYDWETPEKRLVGNREKISDLTKAQDTIALLKEIVEDEEWPEGVEYESYTGVTSLPMTIYPEKGRAEDVELLKSARSVCLRLGGPMERNFDSYTGRFSWLSTMGRMHGEVRVTFRLSEANALSPQCKIEEVTETVTRYKSVCPEDENREEVAVE